MGFLPCFFYFQQQKIQVERLTSDFQEAVQRFQTLQKVIKIADFYMYTWYNNDLYMHIWYNNDLYINSIIMDLVHCIKMTCTCIPNITITCACICGITCICIYGVTIDLHAGMV